MPADPWSQATQTVPKPSPWQCCPRGRLLPIDSATPTDQLMHTQQLDLLLLVPVPQLCVLSNHNHRHPNCPESPCASYQYSRLE
jgi:hypothetical protein